MSNQALKADIEAQECILRDAIDGGDLQEQEYEAKYLESLKALLAEKERLNIEAEWHECVICWGLGVIFINDYGDSDMCQVCHGHGGRWI